MTTVDVTTAFAAALVDEWARVGRAPTPSSRRGRAPRRWRSRSPRDDRIRVHVVLDERSAAFRALGIGLATGRPAIVCCTSGPRPRTSIRP